MTGLEASYGLEVPQIIRLHGWPGLSIETTIPSQPSTLLRIPNHVCALHFFVYVQYTYEYLGGLELPALIPSVLIFDGNFHITEDLNIYQGWWWTIQIYFVEWERRYQRIAAKLGCVILAQRNKTRKGRWITGRVQCKDWFAKKGNCMSFSFFLAI